MNVTTFGNAVIGYCETVAGGAGAVSSHLSYIDKIFVLQSS